MLLEQTFHNRVYDHPHTNPKPGVFDLAPRRRATRPRRVSARRDPRPALGTQLWSNACHRRSAIGNRWSGRRIRLSGWGDQITHETWERMAEQQTPAGVATIHCRTKDNYFRRLQHVYTTHACLEVPVHPCSKLKVAPALTPLASQEPNNGAKPKARCRANAAMLLPVPVPPTITDQSPLGAPR